jgi:hypothetical protein
MWWLAFQRDGRPFCVVIVEAESLYDAKIKASFNNLGRGGIFTAGHRLDAHSAALLTEADINRTLSAAEAEQLIARFQRGRTEGKKPAVASIRRRRERRSA